MTGQRGALADALLHLQAEIESVQRAVRDGTKVRVRALARPPAPMLAQGMPSGMPAGRAQAGGACVAEAAWSMARNPIKNPA